MSMTCEHQEQRDRAHKIYVVTTHSQDGRSLDGYWMDYNPDDKYALFLMEWALNQSEGVDYYSVYDADGVRNRFFDSEKHPKRM